MTLTRERARSQDLSLTMSCPEGIDAIEADEKAIEAGAFN